MITITPKTATEALRYARTADRAAALLTEGYEFLLLDEIHVVSVVRPEGGQYYLDLISEECDCPDFQKHGDYCKHLLCWQTIDAANEIGREELLCAEAEDRYYSDCDPYDL